MPAPIDPRPPKLPLRDWASLHPLAIEVAEGRRTFAAVPGQTAPRSASLAERLAVANGDWGNDVRGELSRWLAGADVIVAGQQPGLLGGPLLTLVKACAVAAEVARRRASGREAVGFLWLATGDDDLPEMGWGRVALGDELLEVREDGWRRGACLGGDAPLGPGCQALLSSLSDRLPAEHAREALAHAEACFVAGRSLGEACARFLAHLLAGTGIVLVDAREPELASAAAGAVDRLLERLPEAWEILAAAAAEFGGLGWTIPLRHDARILPLYRRDGDRRLRMPAVEGGCPPGVREEQLAHPRRFLPNVWLRPLVQDAALGSSAAFLGGAELAYHAQAAGLWPLAGIAQPEWRLRPHLTVATAAERRLAAQLGLEPAALLHSRPPGHLLPGKGVRGRVARLRSALQRQLDELETASRRELPALRTDLEATRQRLDGSLSWFAERAEKAAAQTAEVGLARWRRLRAFLRPNGRPQERELSVLAPLLRLGLEWPRRLAGVLDPGDPGMQLLFWGEGAPW